MGDGREGGRSTGWTGERMGNGEQGRGECKS